MRTFIIFATFFVLLINGCSTHHLTAENPSALPQEQKAEAKEEVDIEMVRIILYILSIEEDDLMSAEHFFVPVRGAREFPDICLVAFNEEGYHALKDFARMRYGNEEETAMRETMALAIAYFRAYVILSLGDKKPPLTQREVDALRNALKSQSGVLFLECMGQMYGIK